jgi:hypothetical protein
MTRHGMVKTSVAGVTPPATVPHASVAIIAADRVAASLGRAWKSARTRKEATCPHPSSHSLTAILLPRT